MQAKQSSRRVRETKVQAWKAGRVRDGKEVEGNKNSLKSLSFSFLEEQKLSIFNLETRSRDLES